MIEQGFYVGDKEWYVMCAYLTGSEGELDKVYKSLLLSGCKENEAKKMVTELKKVDSGVTFSSFAKCFSYVCIGEASSKAEMYDTIQHELRHVVEHISEYYGINRRSERAAYMQGDIAKKMYPVVEFLICRRNG